MLHEAGLRLQNAHEALQVEVREMAGEAAYWRALAEARAQDLVAYQAGDPYPTQSVPAESTGPRKSSSAVGGLARRIMTPSTPPRSAPPSVKALWDTAARLLAPGSPVTKLHFMDSPAKASPCSPVGEHHLQEHRDRKPATEVLHEEFFDPGPHMWPALSISEDQCSPLSVDVREPEAAESPQVMADAPLSDLREVLRQAALEASQAEPGRWRRLLAEQQASPPVSHVAEPRPPGATAQVSAHTAGRAPSSPPRRVSVPCASNLVRTPPRFANRRARTPSPGRCLGVPHRLSFCSGSPHADSACAGTGVRRALFSPGKGLGPQPRRDFQRWGPGSAPRRCSGLGTPTRKGRRS